jgi:hypothetical protein
MSERVDSVPFLSFIEGERRARIKRTLVIEACLRGTLHTFSEWVRVAAVGSARVLHDLAARGAAPFASSIGSTIEPCGTSASRAARSNPRCARDCPCARCASHGNTTGTLLHASEPPSRKRLAARRLPVGARERERPPDVRLERTPRASPGKSKGACAPAHASLCAQRRLPESNWKGTCHEPHLRVAAAGGSAGRQRGS